MSQEDVANQALTSIRFRLASKQSYVAKPKAMPLEEGKILSDKDPWPSPTVPGIINSWLAVEWLVARHYSDPKPKFEAPWWSRLVPKHGILTNRSTHDSYLCLFTGKWGVVTMIWRSVVSGVGRRSLFREVSCVAESPSTTIGIVVRSRPSTGEAKLSSGLRATCRVYCLVR